MGEQRPVVDARTGELLARLRRLVGDLDASAAEKRVEDPGFDGRASLSATPEGGGVRVRVGFSYLSGGGAQTATALEDTVRFFASAGRLIDVVLARDGSDEQVGTIEEQALPAFERRMREFLTRPLRG